MFSKLKKIEETFETDLKLKGTIFNLKNRFELSVSNIIYGKKKNLSGSYLVQCTEREYFKFITISWISYNLTTFLHMRIKTEMEV